MTDEEQRRQEQRIKRRKQTKSGNIKQKSYDVASVSTFITNLPLTVQRKKSLNYIVIVGRLNLFLNPGKQI